MFKKNTKHQQPSIISVASELPEKQCKRLENLSSSNLVLYPKTCGSIADQKLPPYMAI